MSDERPFRNRILIPLLIPVGILVGVGFFIINLSRVLLAFGKDVAVIVGVGASAIILAGAAWAATRKRIARGTLVALVAFLALAVGTAGAVSARLGEHPIEKHEAEEPHGKPTEKPTTKPTPTATGAQTTGGATVSSANLAFKPKDLTVASGTTVRWTMDDSLPHTVTSAPGAPVKFDSGNKNAGETYEFTFTTPGTYPYYCIYHGTASGQGMAGTVTVT